MKKIPIITIIISSMALFILESETGISLFSSILNKLQTLLAGEFFIDITTFILAGFLIFYIIQIIEMLFQLFIDHLISNKDNMLKSKFNNIKGFRE